MKKKLKIIKAKLFRWLGITKPIERVIEELCAQIHCTIVLKNGVKRFSI